MMKKFIVIVLALALFSACARDDNSPQKQFGDDSNYFLALQASDKGNEHEALRLFKSARKKGSPLIAKRSAESLTMLGSVKERIESANYLADTYTDESSLTTACREFFLHGEYASIIKRTDGISLETSKNELIKLRLLSLAEKKDSRFDEEFFKWYISRPISSEHLETYSTYVSRILEKNKNIQAETEKFQKNLNKRNLLESQLAPAEPKAATDASDIRELNVSNNLSVTYTDEQGNLSGTLRILIILTLIAMAPFLVIMMTSFTRILIVLHFVRAAIGTQTAPPNQVLVGLTLFLTFFIMNPVITDINNNAVKPFEAGEIQQEEFLDEALKPLREFMYPQTQTKDVRLFMDIAKIESVDSVDDIPTRVLVPAFVISELRRAFIIGFLIYIPFIVIDMVVASTLMSMGMMMLPPTTISMPFKILLFVLADGWNLVIGNLVKTFY